LRIFNAIDMVSFDDLETKLSKAEYRDTMRAARDAMDFMPKFVPMLENIVQFIVTSQRAHGCYFGLLVSTKI
jgi:hypothetical protein